MSVGWPATERPRFVATVVPDARRSRAVYVQSMSHVRKAWSRTHEVFGRGVSIIPGHLAMTPRCSSSIAVRVGARLVFGVPST